MSARAYPKLVQHVFGGAAGALVGTMWLAPELIPQTDTAWLLAIWLSALQMAVLVAPTRTRMMGVLCSLGTLVALATLAQGVALGPIGALMLVVCAVGLTVLLELPLEAASELDARSARRRL